MTNIINSQLEDWQRIKEFVNGSESAFKRLVEQYTGLVFSVCRRKLKSSEHAEDATQVTFMLLAEKAKEMDSRVVVASWLYRTAWLTSKWMLRKELVHVLKEKEVSSMTPIKQTPDTELLWQEASFALDDAMATLPEKYRNAIVMHYLDGKTYQEVGNVIGCTEDAARMRATRGLDKLRQVLTRRGIMATSTMIATFLGSRVVEAAPIGLTLKIATGVAGSSTVAAKAGPLAAIANGVTKIFFWAKVKAVATTTAAAMVVAGGTSLGVIKGVDHFKGSVNRGMVVAAESLPAFPGAEGFGAISSGGRGGQVVHVTHLNDDGPGSLRAALMEKGARTVVFDVGGTIELKSTIHAQNENSFLTVAGQTAPGGIMLTGANIWIGGSRNTPEGHDYIFRHFRIRGVHHAATTGSGEDVFSIYKAHRAILDHCSFTGGVDETIGGAGSTDLTIQWCALEESALYGQGGAQHPKGNHNEGCLFGFRDDAVVSIHHTLFAHHHLSMPLFSNITAGDFRNNVIYNWSRYAGSFQTQLGSNIVGNTYISGPNTRKDQSRYRIFAGEQKGGVFFQDNAVLPEYHNLPDHKKFGALWSGFQKTQYLEQPVNTPLVKTNSATEAYSRVLNTAGAWPRDATTRRMVREIRTRTGEHGLSGPYERFRAVQDGPTSKKFDTDRDGMPDAWEREHGLNPEDPSDRNKIVLSHQSAVGSHQEPQTRKPEPGTRNQELNRHAGYTYLEYYLNALADQIIGKSDQTFKVSVAVEGEGLVVCAHGGKTLNWQSKQSPLEVAWGSENEFRKGSTVRLKALPQKDLTVGAAVVSRFSHWTINQSKIQSPESKVQSPKSKVDSGPGTRLRRGFGGQARDHVKRGSHPGLKDPVLNLIVDQDMTVTAHFKP